MLTIDKIKYSDLQTGKTLGSGRNMIVSKAVLADGREAALLIVLNDDLPEERKGIVDQNVTMLRRLGDSSLVVQLLGEVDFDMNPETSFLEGESNKFSRVDNRKFGLLEELCKTNLSDLINSRKPNLREKIELTLQLIAGVRHIHSRSIVHRDLKPANVLIRNDGSLCIADFDFAIDASTEQMCGLSGTERYMAPECFAFDGSEVPKERISFANDIWALGCIITFVFTGKRPFHDFGSINMIRYMYQRKRIPEADELPEFVRPLVKKCLIFASRDRPTASEVFVWFIEAVADRKHDSAFVLYHV
jgi:serine/threonine protein kinase